MDEGSFRDTKTAFNVDPAVSFKHRKGLAKLAKARKNRQSADGYEIQS